MNTLDLINNAGGVDAESMFLDCCGSSEWARQMASARPFGSEDELMTTAATIWNELKTDDHLEAFAAHPKIGEKKAADQTSQSATWSEGEQAGMNSADDLVKRELAAANQAYEDKFGFIFIVCATGRTADEMLSLCRARLGNDRATEIVNAAAEQRKITEIRLQKLLDT